MSVISKPSTGKDVALAGEDSSRRKGAAPALALSPRADLLPPELGESIRRQSVRRGLRIIIVVTAIVAAAGIAAAWQLSIAAQAQLAAQQQKTAALTAQKAKFAEVATTLTGIKVGKAAVKVGGSTDIDWADYLTRLQSNLPEGVTLTTVEAKSADVTSEFAQSTVPLAGTRIASITFTATSSQLPSIPDWIDRLSTLPGFAGASPNSVSGDDKGYTATVTMDVDSDALSHRFAPAAKGEAK